MQERIKELAREAGGHEVDTIDPQCSIGCIAFDDADLARFAQAVARECAQVADEALTKGRSPMGRVAADAIRARFGLATPQDGG